MRGGTGLILCLWLAACAGAQSGGTAGAGGRAPSAWRTAMAGAQHLSAAERRFVTGVTQLELGHYTAARDALLAIGDQLPDLSDEVHYYLAQAQLGSGQPTEALSHFEAVLTQFPTSRHAEAAEEGAIRALHRLGRHDEAMTRLALVTKATSSSWRRVRLAELRARLLRKQGAIDAARAEYLRLYRDAAYPSAAARARAGLAKVGGGRSGVEWLSSAERVGLADRFVRNGMAAEAVRLLEPVAGAEGGAAQEQLAVARFKARQYPQAYPLFMRLVQSGTRSMDRRELLQQTATAAARAGRTSEALALQEQIIREYAGDRAVSQLAQYKRAFLLMDAGRCTEAIPAYQEWLTAGGAGERAASRGFAAARSTSVGCAKCVDARWAIAWCHYQLKQWPEAMAALDGVAAGGDRFTQARAQYWQGRVLERMGRRADARDRWESLLATSGGTYYGLLAERRLRGAGAVQALFAQRAARRAAPPPPPSLPAKADRLFAMGLWDLALDAADHAAGGTFGFGPAHQWAVHQLGRAWGLDPELVLAIMRQESAFRPQVVSPAGAIGLLQLMPLTARRMAREQHLRGFREERLFSPQWNLRLGMWYLRGLQQRYKGQLPLMLAAYNAGEEAVDRWRAQYSQLDLEEFIEIIPYDETRNYVRRILRMYW